MPATAFKHTLKKINPVLGILMALTIIGFVVSCILIGTFLYINISIKSSTVMNEQLTVEKTNLESQVNELEEKKKHYSNLLQNLDDELAKYQPVIIPDSMKE